MNGKYILKGHKAVPCDDLMEWAKWYETANRTVNNTIFADNDVRVSTVFLGLDHSFGAGEPLLFETMIFGGELDGEMDRYTTWEEAEKGHEKLVAKAKAVLSKTKEKK